MKVKIWQQKAVNREGLGGFVFKKGQRISKQLLTVAFDGPWGVCI